MSRTLCQLRRWTRARAPLAFSLLCCLISLSFVDDTLLEGVTGLEKPARSRHHEANAPVELPAGQAEAVPVETDGSGQDPSAAAAPAFPALVATDGAGDQSPSVPYVPPPDPLAKRNHVGVPLRC